MRIMTNQISLGWRARIGLLYPETGSLDEEFWGFAPVGTAVFLARTLVRDKASVEVLTEMRNSPEVERLAKGFSKNRRGCYSLCLHCHRFYPWLRHG